MSRRTGRAAPLALLFLFAPGRATAAASIETRADRTELAEDEVLTLEVRVEAAEAPSKLELPEKLDFTMVSQSQSREASFGFGSAGVQMRQRIAYVFRLAPRRAGRLVIPPFAVTVAGRRLETAPIAVTVRPGPGPRPTPGAGGAWHGWERDLVLAVQLDRKDAWLGEQVTASVWLYSPVGVVRYQSFQPPLYDGFWAEPIETPSLAARIVRIRGVPTRAYLLQRLALFPTRAGTLTVGAFDVGLDVRVGNQNPLDPFPVIRSVRRRSTPAEIVVKPLPAGAPLGFEPVDVGAIALAAELGDRQVSVGQPVTVRVSATGEGNVRAWSLPRLPAIPGTRSFDPAPTEKVAPRAGRIAGTRTEETVLVPETPGELVIPPLPFSWFDPARGRYQAASTPELRIAVAAAAPEAQGAAASDALAAALRPPRAGALSQRGPPPWSSPLFAIALGVPIAAFLAVVTRDRLRAREARGGAARRSAAAGRTARARLRRAEAVLAAETSNFLAEVDRALHGYAADRLGRPAAGMTREALARALAGAGCHPPAIGALVAALDGCDAARFGRGLAAREEVLAAAKGAIAMLEDEDWTRAEVRP